ncbi:MAG: hypothetical protein J6Y78_15125 [Paludibacteraceae bacterium]|nr:hypothetical protein [Paludibacteraceae bacterium]
MTNERAVEIFKEIKSECEAQQTELSKQVFIHEGIEALDLAIKALDQKPIDKSAMMYEIYMEGVNMSGEYQGCWVRFKDIEAIVDKYIDGSDSECHIV